MLHYYLLVLLDLAYSLLSKTGIKPQFLQTRLSKFPNPKRVLTICRIYR